MAVTLQIEYVTGGTGGGHYSSPTRRGQTFTTTNSFTLSSIYFPVQYSLTSGTSFSVNLQATVAGLPSGPVLATGTCTKTTEFGVYDSRAGLYWQHCDMTSYDLQASTTYAYSIYNLSAQIAPVVNTSGDYSGGSDVGTTDGGSTWAANLPWDNIFQLYGTTLLYTQNPVFSKRLVALGGNEVWYESSAGTMEEVTAANGVISTQYPLTAWEGLEKCFIVNGEQKSVLDFGNHTVPTADIGANLPNKGNTLTGGTTTAVMVVDFLTAASASANVYGKKIGTTSFVSGETVTGTNDAGDVVSFALSSAQVSAPNFYTWTPYANDTTTYGTMPDSSIIGCLYRGRCVLAGNINAPHMWYMTKVINPWNWKYSVLDPLTAIRGGNADAGEIGDYITALIPFQDDYLIMGAEHTLWLMRGDPASAGGSIDQLSDTTGMWGQTAWCMDGNSTVYFYGTNGIYSLALENGQGTPINISNAKIPQLTDDWAIDKDLHRVVLSYDDKRKGIIISKITLIGGANESYFYDLSVDGFFPETYPDNLAPYTPFYYKAIDDSYTGLLLGGYDGYIRNFVDSEKSDEDVADAIISSYLTLPILPIVSDSDSDAVIKEVIAETAGGAAGGTYSDTDTVDIAFYTGDDAETVLEDIKDGATAFLTVALVSAGRQAKIREHIRTKYIGIVLSNSVLSSSWAINKIFGEADQGGKK